MQKMQMISDFVKELIEEALQAAIWLIHLNSKYRIKRCDTYQVIAN